MSSQPLQHFYNILIDKAVASHENMAFTLMEEGLEGDMPKLAEEDSSNFPVLVHSQAVLFPGVILPIVFRRIDADILSLLRQMKDSDSLIGLVAARENTLKTRANSPQKESESSGIYLTGTTAKILRIIPQGTEQATLLLRGIERFYIEDIIKATPSLLLAKVFPLPVPTPIDTKKKSERALLQLILETALHLIKLDPEAPTELAGALKSIKNPSFLLSFLAANLNMDLAFKQWLLELDEDGKRGKELLKYLLKEKDLLKLKHDIQNKVHTDLEQQQRDYYLRQHIKVLQNELGEQGDNKETEAFRTQGAKKKWPNEVAKHFNKAVTKLERLHPQSAEYTPQLNYIEFLLELPWGVYTRDKFNLLQAEKVLNQKHYGLEKVKERILEYLAVLQLRNTLRGPILCLHGPPGVGKTSLGASIAAALGRKYVRMSLGGVHDEAEIRGHRKTYVGAMPGKILAGIRKAGTSNPVFVLDEVDKLDSDFRGDPASALLEVLDPEQNHTFVDNFAEVPYDLSRVLFILTANEIDAIPWALHDRVEAIKVNGYAVEEKLHIAKNYLVAQQKKEHGLPSKAFSFYEGALTEVIQHYTQESGVRELSRQIGAIARKVAKATVLEEDYPKRIKKSDIPTLLGAQKFDPETAQQLILPGIAIGLSWSPVGGGILFIETTLAQGKGKVISSGQLGDVMEESAMTALSYLRSHADELQIDYRVFDQYDLHIHVPEGATPKDGPSAGITLFTALASLYTQRKVRNGLAMSGEITLRGKVLPVGGIKEKVLAAQRAGLKTIILSQQNKRDVDEINPEFIKGLTFHYIDMVNELLPLALHPNKIKGAKVWKIEEDTAETEEK